MIARRVQMSSANPHQGRDKAQPQAVPCTKKEEDMKNVYLAPTESEAVDTDNGNDDDMDLSD